MGLRLGLNLCRTVLDRGLKSGDGDGWLKLCNIKLIGDGSLGARTAFLRADYTDDIAIPDPEKSGACKDFLAGMVTGLDNGEEIMQSWADNGLTVPGANSAALESVTTGEKGILIAGVDYNAYSSMADGEPLAIYYPASGTVVNPRPAMIMNTAPNADNAKAFIDFLFSDEAQQMVAEAYLLPGRSDIQCEGRTNLADIPQLPTDWTAMMDVADDTAAHLNEICQ